MKVKHVKVRRRKPEFGFIFIPVTVISLLLSMVISSGWLLLHLIIYNGYNPIADFAVFAMSFIITYSWFLRDDVCYDYKDEIVHEEVKV